ncbi:glutathione S-transferase [Camelimonas fluminis]|uniref:Glutathione S-transferase family protein n=1 Tax=Camelimonas fluminis TaxID=1576911 RepID=A0ABV7UCA3_9HYPH|nr:glutathione S-transferase family protein [Camelimonas fluminis]GHE64674.1 glutathione S-transferase [Camelimonas fluminis]
MLLRTSPFSPFVRMALIAIDVLGLADRVGAQPAAVMPPDPELARQNPLGKIPVLVLDDGRALYDSRVIIDYLDHVAGGGLIIPAGSERYEAMRVQALAIGVIEAAVLQVYEARYRPEERRHQAWVDAQAAKTSAGLTAFEAAPPPQPGASCHGRPDVGQIALACALGYLDLRFDGLWRASHPRLVSWLDAFASAVPAFETTRPTV